MTTFRTPAGTPASSASNASASDVRGVSSAGLATTVQPAASAGAILRAIIAAGKFQGVIAATTPTPSLHDQHLAAADRLRNHVAVAARRLLGEPLDVRGRIEDLPARFGKRLSLFPREMRRAKSS